MPVINHILSALLSVPPDKQGDFHKALQTRPILPVIFTLLIIRWRRFLTKRIRWLFGGEPPNSLKCESIDVNRRDGPWHPGRVPPEPESTAFPEVLFQTWKTKDSIPENYERWSSSLRRLNPGYRYFLWDDQDNRLFVESHYQWFLPFYDTYPREIFRADAVRYFFLYHFGGLYADMDTECLAPLSDLFESGDVWLGRMGNDPDFPHSIPNAIMASKPRQEFWLLVIYLICKTAKEQDDEDSMAEKGPEALTGPVVLKRACDMYVSANRSSSRQCINEIASLLPPRLQPQQDPSKIRIFEPEIWYPIDWSNMLHYRLSSAVVDFNEHLGEKTKRWLFPNSRLVTYWSHSWKQPKSETTDSNS